MSAARTFQVYVFRAGALQCMCVEHGLTTVVLQEDLDANSVVFQASTTGGVYVPRSPGNGNCGGTHRCVCPVLTPASMAYRPSLTPYHGIRYLTAFQWDNIVIPNGAYIATAKIRFVVDSPGSEACSNNLADVYLRGEHSVNSVQLSTTTGETRDLEVPLCDSTSPFAGLTLRFQARSRHERAPLQTSAPMARDCLLIFSTKMLEMCTRVKS